MGSNRIGLVLKRSVLCVAMAILHAVVAGADGPLSEPQQALFRALETAAPTTGAAQRTETQDGLRALLTEWLTAKRPAPPGYQFAAQDTALDGIPDDGLPHPVRVARDVFVLQGDEQVFAFRRMLDCAGSAASDGPMRGVPQIQCEDR